MEVLLWRQCAKWLCHLKVLPPNHRILQEDTCVEDLAYTLRDGVVLCYIVATIDQTSIDLKSVNQRPQMARFLCLKNINIFLSSCKNFYDLKPDQLFDPSNLYDYTDFESVLETLSRLSKCPKARSKFPLGFPPNTSICRTTKEEEQIYQRLEDTVNDDNYEEFYYSHHGGGTSNYAFCSSSGLVRQESSSSGVTTNDISREHSTRKSLFYTPSETEENVYTDLCELRKGLAAIPRASTSPSTSSTQAGPQMSRLSLLREEWIFEPKEKRDHCLKELIETEANYVDVLNMLRKNFIKDIIRIREVDKKIIFMNIKELGDIHGAFYHNLVKSVTNKSHKKIGEIFLDYKEKFLKYGDYCSELPRAQELLETLCAKDEGIRREIAECEQRANEGRFFLRDLLAVPMQRILKYHLLLKQLSSQTRSNHEDHHSLQQAYEAMLDVSDFINEVKRDSEHFEVIREIQNSIMDWEMPPGIELKYYGRLRKDGELKVQSHEGAAGGGTPKAKLRYVFTFDKILLICKALKGDHYSFKESVNLSDYRMQDLSSPSASTVTLVGGSSNGGTSTTRRVIRRESAVRWTHSFILVHLRQLNAFNFMARTIEDKKKWMEAISEALNSNNPVQALNSTHNTLMHTFDKPTHCAACFKLMKGLFYQGYICSKCLIGVHRECIPLLPPCGMLIPPELPPRPPILPIAASKSQASESTSISSSSSEVNNINFKVIRQARVGSLPQLPEIPSPPRIPPPPSSPSMGSIPNGSNPNYVNTDMEEHSWYVGSMDRDFANSTLKKYPPCTFLVRRRTQDGQAVGYALSLRTDNDVKHMKIYTDVNSHESNNELVVNGCRTNVFYLSDTRKFKSIVELVQWFSRHSLKESFYGLDTMLKFPLKELTLVEALYDFVPTPGSKNMLPLRAGKKLTIIDKSSGSQGWWKACSGNQIGYIPKEFVKHVTG